MKITAFSLLAAASLVSASPVLKRQDVSSAVASATSAIMGTSTTEAQPSASASSAPSDFGAGLLAALRERDATTLADLLEPLADQLVPTLQEGSWTLFAPGNEYLAEVPESITSNQTALARVLQYHIAAGSYPTEQLMVNMTAVPTTLASADMLGDSYSTLPLPFVKNQFGTTVLIGQNATVLANSTYENILIKLIDGVLSIPGPVPEVIAANGGDAFTGYLNSLLPDVVQTLNSTAGITVFSPTNEAASQRAADITGLPTDQVTSAVQQHVLQGIYYSPNITDGLSLPTLAGNEMMFTVNDTGVFVMAGDASAQVVSTDYQASNGVVHFIDRLLLSATTPGPNESMSASGSMGAVESATDAAGAAASSATEAIASAVPTSA